MRPMTPKERVMRVLHGDLPDRTPFTIYEGKIPSSLLEEAKQQHGVCAVRRIRSYTLRQPNVSVRSYEETDQAGHKLVRQVYSTPYGDLTTSYEPAGFTSWRKEYMYKTPEDYKRLRFLIEDTVVAEDYAAAAQVKASSGDACVVRDNLPLEPMQSLISSHYMSMADYCTEWMDRRDEILVLYEKFAAIARRIYPIVAAGPLDFANYGGNVVPQIIGSEGFRKYYMPHYDEAAAIMHQHGKLLGTHLDADNTPIMADVAETDLDYIEAYDAGISPPVSVARQIWPEKTLWLNFPSAWHLEPLETVRARTRQLLQEGGTGERLIVGITEDMPGERAEENFRCIMETICEYVGSSIA